MNITGQEARATTVQLMMKTRLSAEAAVEPDPVPLFCLQKNLGEIITISNLVLSSYDGESIFYESSINADSSTK